jgi:hypothetical protein
MTTKNLFSLLLSEATFASFFKDKKLQRSHKTVINRNFGFSYYFCLIIEGSGAGSRRPKKHTDPADPDPQHWLLPTQKL